VRDISGRAMKNSGNSRHAVATSQCGIRLMNTTLVDREGK